MPTKKVCLAQFRHWSAIGIPVMAGEFLMSVIVFLCGDDEDHTGAIEVLANDLNRSGELGMVAGYYVILDYFELISRKTKIMTGFGLPGQVWEKGMPVLDHDLGESTSVIRGKEARGAGIQRGLRCQSLCILSRFISWFFYA